MRQLAIALFICIAFEPPGLGEDCNTNCHDQCRFKTDFPPIEFIEPTCHAKCEAAKQIACKTKATIPNVPVTPLEQAKAGATLACEAPFQALTNWVIARCSNWDGRLENQYLIDNASTRLQNLGIITPADLNGVQVRWCPLSG